MDCQTFHQNLKLWNLILIFPDHLYKINQFWHFISSEGNDRLSTALAKALSLPVSFVKEQGGAWFINIKRKSNYARLNATQRSKIDLQVTKMLSHKYQFINYNGLRKAHLPKLQKKMGQPNIFLPMAKGSGVSKTERDFLISVINIYKRMRINLNHLIEPITV